MVYRSGKGCIPANRPLFLIGRESDFWGQFFSLKDNPDDETSGYGLVLDIGHRSL